MQVFLLELKLLFRDRASWVLLFLFAGSLGYGVWNGSQSAQASRDSVKKVGERVDSFEENLVPKLMARKYPASRYLFYGESAALPAAPLPYLATGQSDLSPNHDRVTLMRRHIPRGSRSEIQNPANLMAGRFDLAFVLVWLYPLFLLGLAYDLIAGDRETGTFRLALAQGVSPARILVLRAFARALPVITLAIVGTFAASVLDDSAATDLRVVLAAAIVLVYGLFWSSLAAWVNSRSRSAAGSATGLGAAWVTLVLVVPTMLNVVVESLHPTPSRAELVAVSRQSKIEVGKREDEAAESFYLDHPELAPEGEGDSYRLRQLMVQEEMAHAVEPVEQEFKEQVAQQQAAIANWRFVSPAIAAYESLTDLAGTGYWRYRAFHDQVHDFEEVVSEYFTPLVHRGGRLTQEEFDAKPRFVFQEDSSWSTRAYISLAGMGGLVVLFVLLSMWGVRARAARV